MKQALCATIVLLAMTVVAEAQGQGLDTSSLSAEQRAALELQLEQMKSKNDSPLPSVDEMEEWTEWGQGMGVAIAATAKELGVAVEDFSQTGVGKVTIAVIVYKVIGDDVIGLCWGCGLLMVGFPMWFSMTKRIMLIERIEETETTEDGKTVKKKIIHPRRMDCEGDFARLAGCIVVLVALFAVSGAFIL